MSPAIDIATAKPSELARFALGHRSLDELAADVGVSRRQVYYWLAGKVDGTRKPNTRGLVNLRRTVATLEGISIPELPSAPA